jgi:hypothetical protein
VAGETDLERMLAKLDVERRPGRFTFVTGEWPTLRPAALAIIEEAEGTTLVVPSDAAALAGAPVEFEAAWLTLTIHSALEAVGLTAAFSKVLGDGGIPCNVLAGYHHDHVLVPVDRVEEAVAALRTLGSGSD